MKLIPESTAFDVVNTALNLDTVEGCLIGRLESYSCKMVAEEKTLYKKFSRSDEAGIHDLQALSPPRYGIFCGPLPRSMSSSSSSGGSSTSLPASSDCLVNTRSSSVSSNAGAQHLEDNFGDEQEDKILRKTLFYLVSTLNAAFYPDYDFSNATSREFSREHSLQHVIQAVERQLTVVSQSQLPKLSEQIWTAVDEAVHLNDCEIYTYNPDEHSDPYSDDGCVWSFNYFFYNPRLKRVVFFSCRLATPLFDTSSAGGDSLDYYMDSDVDFDD